MLLIGTYVKYIPRKGLGLFTLYPQKKGEIWWQWKYDFDIIYNIDDIECTKTDSHAKSPILLNDRTK